MKGVSSCYGSGFNAMLTPVIMDSSARICQVLISCMNKEWAKIGKRRVSCKEEGEKIDNVGRTKKDTILPSTDVAHWGVGVQLGKEELGNKVQHNNHKATSSQFEPLPRLESDAFTRLVGLCC
jgi:hypothetical protein